MNEAEERFKCERCKGEFFLLRNENWTKEDQLKEMKELFGEVPAEETMLVCDNCFKQIDPRNFAGEAV